MSVPSQFLAPGWLSEPEAAAFLRISQRTLQRRRDQRRVAFARDGNRVLYRKADLDAYRESQVVEVQTVGIKRRVR